MTRGNIGELVIGMEKWGRGVSSGGWNFIPSEPYTRKPTKNPKGKGGEGQKTFKVFTLKVFLREGEMGISGGSIRNSKIIVLLQ